MAAPASRKGLHQLARSLCVSLGLLLVLAPSAGFAFETADGRFSMHGFYEMQFRTISKNYSDDFDVTQWYNVLNLEFEANFLEDVGPISLLSAFVRVEGRYDCIYSHGCGMFKNVNTYGNHARNLPERLSDSKEIDGAGVIPLQGLGTVDFSDPPRRPRPLSQLAGFSDIYKNSKGGDAFVGIPDRNPKCLALYGPIACSQLAGGLNAPYSQIDDPVPPVLGRFDNFRFTQIAVRGGSNFGLGILPLGPWLPKNNIQTIASMADLQNPMDNSETSDLLKINYYNSYVVNNGFAPFVANNPGYVAANPDNPVNLAVVQTDIDQGFAQAETTNFTYSGALPYRPIPVNAPGGRGHDNSTARGLFVPHVDLRRLLDSDDLANFPFNYDQTERAFNRGQSQQQTGELKEAYIDAELFDSRVWLRIGLQTIVWGKTELFSATDQFNPQDFALATLASLEETRIPLWSIRGTYSFYNVGPLSDVRLELGLIIDEFQPADLGACGEPYTVDLVCGATFGGFAHGFTGIGVVGVKYPESGFHSWEGWQYGGRVEFRWDRFSFAISDFYGYDDFPHPERIVTYERNVDPYSGLPRVANARGPCWSAFRREPDCLYPGPTERSDPNGTLNDPRNALDQHPANQTLFAFACAATIGVAGSTDPSACGTTVFNSQAAFRNNVFTATQIISATLAGSQASSALALFAVIDDPEIPDKGPNAQTRIADELRPLVKLSRDTGDLENRIRQENPTTGAIAFVDTGCMDSVWYDNPSNTLPNRAIATCGGEGHTTFDQQVTFPPENDYELNLAETLSTNQEALLGCGPVWGINCDVSGIDLLNAEGSVLVQSWPGFEGTGPNWRTDITMDADGNPVYQPGTVNFVGGPICTTAHIGGPRDPSIKLPGCRGPGDPGYHPPGPFLTPDNRLDFGVDGDPMGVGTLINTSNLQYFAQYGYTNDLQNGQVANTPGHPFTGQPWQNELAALSWNLLVLVVLGSDNFEVKNAYTNGECGFITPQYCDSVQGFLTLAGVRRNTIKAGGNEQYGRRDLQWHGGGSVALAYNKRNVLGFGMDFAEDVTKTNWSIEATWVDQVYVLDANEFSGLNETDEFNMTISMDRPTFINFLNDGRSLFFNSQWFFNYRPDHKKSWAAHGPVNVLATFTVLTGYFQDRLNPQLTFVYDFMSVSGAVLPQIEYKVSAAFSFIVGASIFWGQEELTDMGRNPIALGSRAGSDAYKDFNFQGLSAVKNRDELFLRLRYSF